MNEKYTDSDIHLNGKLYEKFDNFWFYHKWHVIAAVFVVFVLAVCIAQSCSREVHDADVLYAGPRAYTASERETVGGALSDLASAGLSDRKTVGLVTYNVMSKEQIQELKDRVEEYNDAEAKDLIVDTSYYTSEQELYSSALMTGHYAVLLVDEWLYEKLAADEGRLRKLSDVFVTVPDSAIDAYGIRFSETALYKSNELFGGLPETTVLCLLSPYVIGSTSKGATYAQMVDLFVKMAADAS